MHKGTPPRQIRFGFSFCFIASQVLCLKFVHFYKGYHEFGSSFSWIGLFFFFQCYSLPCLILFVRSKPKLNNTDRSKSVTQIPSVRSRLVFLPYRFTRFGFGINSSPSPALVGCITKLRPSSASGFMAFSVAAKLCSPMLYSTTRVKPVNDYKLQSGHVTLTSQEASSSNRRNILAFGGISLVAILTFNYSCLTPSLAWAGEEPNGQEDKDEGVVGAIKSFLDPDEKTKAGKVLPKAYLKSAREVVKTLRESLKEDPKDNAKFRRTADAAKASIREYLGGWRGNQTVVNEESYVTLEKAIRSLAGFYSKAGPSAPLPEEVKSKILNDLNTAEEFL